MEVSEEIMDILQSGKVGRCSKCTQDVHLSKRNIYSTLARGLIYVYNLHGTREYFHTDELKKISGKSPNTLALLKHWDLIVSKPNDDPKKSASGFWKITPKGEEFVKGKLRIPKTARIFNKTLFWFEGEMVDINQCLGTEFDVRKL